MSQPVDSILIPTDDSPAALTGAKWAIALASRTGADVHILSVVDVRDDQVEGANVPRSAFASLEDDAEDAVETVAEMVRSHDPKLEVTPTIRRATPFQTIREYATRHEIDVIAMGTKGRTGLDSVRLGSVTENVLRTAHRPVFAVPPAADATEIDAVAFDDFLVPTDGSEGATIAVDWGLALARRLDSMVHAVFSVDTGRLSRANEPAELLDALEQTGADELEAIRRRARDADVGVSASIATGPPVAVILTTASDRAVDLIVMGTHGRTGIGQWFLGSVTENVVRQADVPVCCVPVSAETPRQ